MNHLLLSSENKKLKAQIKPLLLIALGRTRSDLLRSDEKVYMTRNHPFGDCTISFLCRLSDFPFFGESPNSNSVWTYSSILLKQLIF